VRPNLFANARGGVEEAFVVVLCLEWCDLKVNEGVEVAEELGEV